MNKLFKLSLLYLFLGFSITSAAAIKNDVANDDAWTREYNKIEEQRRAQYSSLFDAQKQEKKI